MVMGGKVIVGVGFLLFSRNSSGVPELFTIVELGSKPEYGKSSGMLTFPMETFEARDGDFRGTLGRLIREEVGASPEEIVISGIVPGFFLPIPERKYLRLVYGYGLFTGDREQVFTPEDGDVRFASWSTIEFLQQQNVRAGVLPVLEHFVQNHFDRLFKKCAQVVV